MENWSNLAMGFLFAASVALLATVLLRLVRKAYFGAEPSETPSEDDGERPDEGMPRPDRPKGPWGGYARSGRSAARPGSGAPSVAADGLERRFSTVFATVPPRRREDLIAHALRRLGTADRAEAMAYLLDERARGR